MVHYGLISSESKNALPNSHPSSLPETLPETDPNMAAASALMCLGRCEDRIMPNKSHKQPTVEPTVARKAVPTVEKQGESDDSLDSVNNLFNSDSSSELEAEYPQFNCGL